MNAPRRRFFRFSMRTLFMVVTIAACWLSYQVDWIRERHALLARSEALSQRGQGVFSRDDMIDPTAARYEPHQSLWSIRLFGEPAVRWVWVPEAPGRKNPLAHRWLSRAKELFPEAAFFVGRPEIEITECCLPPDIRGHDLTPTECRPPKDSPAAQAGLP